MTTTNTYQGIENINKPTSRVLNPPGGKSNNIFGSDDIDEREKAKMTNAERNRQSSIFTAGEIPEPEHSTAGKRHYPTRGMNPITGQMEAAGQQATPSKKQAEVNPITGLVYGQDTTATDGPAGLSRKERLARERVAPELLPAAGAAFVKQPPGGKSSGPLW